MFVLVAVGPLHFVARQVFDNGLPLLAWELLGEILHARFGVFFRFRFGGGGHEAEKIFSVAPNNDAMAGALQHGVRSVAQEAAIGARFQLLPDDGVNVRTLRQVQLFGNGGFVVDALQPSGFDEAHAGRQVFGKGGG